MPKLRPSTNPRKIIIEGKAANDELHMSLLKKEWVAGIAGYRGRMVVTVNYGYSREIVINQYEKVNRKGTTRSPE